MGRHADADFLIMEVFTYGTLMFEAVWLRVTGVRRRGTPARITGFCRRRVRGEVYPALVRAEAGEELQGILYSGVSPEELDRLDRFEGDCYRRILVTCRLDAGNTVEAHAFLFTEGHEELLAEEEWDAPLFYARHLGQFLADIP